MAEKHLVECRNGRSLMADPVRVAVENMGQRINSERSDYGALVTADGATLIYTSRRPQHSDAKVNKATGEYFEDILSSRSVNGLWSEADPLPAPVNTAGNDASVGLFNDGRTLILYRDVKGTGDLWETRRNGDSWSEPTPFGPNINSPYHESSAWYSFDRQWLYFISDRPDDNVGGQDIYRSRWDAGLNDWGKAENLGPTVNSIHDEEGVFVHPDGKTLYFSSRGHTSMGGYDVFRSRLENGQWTKPENLGWPVNSPDDDLFFVLTADGTMGYFSSLRPGGMGEDDLYQVRFLPDEEPTAMLDDRTAGAMPGVAEPVIEESGTVLLKGMVKNLRMLAGMEAEIELMDLQDASLVARFSSDATTGEYMVVVPSGRNYAMYVKAEGFLLHSENISVPAGQRSISLAIDIEMEPLESGSQVALRNLFFATASATLEQSSLTELEQLVKLMEGSPALRLEISGHTDSDGSASFNQKLSEARAQAVKDHLLTKGVDPGRLVAVGMGNAQPVAPNDSDANKAKNRRTEIKVL